MPCLLPEGLVTETEKALLGLLAAAAATPEELSRQAGQPLYLVRSQLRKLLELGLVQEEDGKYSITDAVKAPL
jgi:predicted transcriptional regulator